MKDKLSPEQLKVLARIQNSIPKEWIDNASTIKPMSPTLVEMIERALVDPEVSEETKAKCLTIKNSGYLEKTISVDNPKFTKLIDDYVMREIKKSVKRGELPKKLIKKNDKNIN
jgi:hypothetical protein